MTPEEAIATLYRLASKAAHPDHGGDNEIMVRVNTAADVLRKGGAPPPPSREPWQADMVMPFGKHKGKRLAGLPGDYLTWMAMHMDDASWRDCAKAVLAWRAQH